MESSLQKIIAAIVGVLMFFIIPVYIAFEKVDDVSYTLTLKLTQNFVDNARDKGYISPDMYSDFVSGLYATNNSYDVTIQHVKKRYDPALYIYGLAKDKNGNNIKGDLLYTLDYDKYVTDGVAPNEITIDDVVYKAEDNCKIEIAHTLNEEIVTDEQIINKIFQDTGITKEEFIQNCITGNTDMYKSLQYMNENSYLMNEGDQINVTVRNKNQTIASTFYSMLTANVGTEDVAKIYVDYGGSIKNDGTGVITYNTGLVESEVGRLFRYRGQAEEVILEPGKYQIECWGASGGGQKGGKGAYAKGIYNITEETTLYVYVGGKGTEYGPYNIQNGGYNGGGSSYKGSGGGGATDVRLYKGDWNDTTSLLTRIVVAAGGGGASKVSEDGKSGSGGAGGNLSEGIYGSIADGKGPIIYRGKGASRYYISVGYDKYKKEDDVIAGADIELSIPTAEKGHLGQGGSVDFDGAGAGGSGYFGGSAAHNVYGGGGGGLSYIYGYDINNRVSAKNGKYYPFNTQITAYYGLDILETARSFIATNGAFIGIINNDSDSDEKNSVIRGNQSMPNPLSYEGETMVGNSGNGYAIIKKLK